MSQSFVPRITPQDPSAKPRMTTGGGRGNQAILRCSRSALRNHRVRRRGRARPSGPVPDVASGSSRTDSMLAAAEPVDGLYPQLRRAFAVLTDRMKGTSNRSGFLRCCHGVILAAVLIGLCVSPASATNIVEQFSWQSPAMVDPSAGSTLGICQTPGYCFGGGSEGLSLISCPSSSLCVAADRSGNVLTSTNPTGGANTWSLAHVDGNTSGASNAYFQGISCPSASFCAGVDSAGYVFTTADPAAGAAADWGSAKISGEHDLTAVSCPSASLCVAVDNEGNVITSTSPTSGASAWHTEKIDEGPCPAEYCKNINAQLPPVRTLDTISCPSASLCVAGDWDGDVVTSSNPTGGSNAWSVTHVDSNLVSGGVVGKAAQAEIVSVSCPSVSLCVASDGVGEVLTSQSPTGGASAWRSRRATPTVPAPLPAPDLTTPISLTCPTVSLCAGLHSPTEVALTYQPLSGVEWERVVVDPTGELTAISCPTASLCLAVDRIGDVIVGRLALPTHVIADRPASPTRRSPTRRQIRRLLRAEITPHGRTQTIGGLSGRRAFLLSLHLPVAGHVQVRWLFPMPLARHRSHRLLIGHGQADLTAGTSTTIHLVLARSAIARLHRKGRIRLLAEAVFSPPHSQPITVTKPFALTR